MVGVNIGRTKLVGDDAAVADYVASATLLAEVAGYLVVNVSSPNTPGLRTLQDVAHLRPLLVGVLTVAARAQLQHEIDDDLDHFDQADPGDQS